MLTATIIIQGEKELSKKVENLVKKIEQPKQPFEKTSNMIHQAIVQNFWTEGDTFGEPWPAPSLMTVRLKMWMKEQGVGSIFDPFKLMWRTGRLMGSFESAIEGMTLTIFNKVPYSKIQQEGGIAPGFTKKEAEEVGRALRPWRGVAKGGLKRVTKTVRIPRRVLMKLDEARVQGIFSIFKDWVLTSIQEVGLKLLE